MVERVNIAKRINWSTNFQGGPSVGNMQKGVSKGVARICLDVEWRTFADTIHNVKERCDVQVVRLLHCFNGFTQFIFRLVGGLLRFNANVDFE